MAGASPMVKLVRISIFLILVCCSVRLVLAQGTCSNFAGGSCPANIPPGVTKFYFIDPSVGSDSNNGTTESTAWAHAPGMTGTTKGVGPGTIDIYNGSGGDNCGSSTCDFHGYGFIFRGGATTSYGTGARGGLPWIMREMGTSAAPLYFGYDPGWYTGSSWSRPIFNAGGANGNLCGNTSTAANGNTCNPMWLWSPTGYVIADNFEWTGYYWYANSTGGTLYNGQETIISFARCNSGGNCIIENMYVHGWSHHAYSSGANPDVCDLFAGDTSIVDRTSVAEYNVIDGSDTAEDACVAFWGGPPFAYHNYIHGVPNGAVVDSAIAWGGNRFDTMTSSYDTTQHQNTFEDNGANNNEIFYNNFITNTTNANGLTLNFAPCAGTTTYVFNNVLGNTDDTPLNVQPECGAGTLYVFNNTIELGADSVAGTGNSGVGTGTYPGCPSGLSGCIYRNNQFIGTNNQSSQVCNATCTDTTNLSQTIAVAKANSGPTFNQYAFSQFPYVIAPVASTNSTAAAGTNSTSVCTTISGINSVAGTACASDTQYSLIYNTTAHTVSVPGRPTNARPISAAWDIGAYFFNGLSAPTGLVAVVN
jgi:hypothetical protein